MSHRIPVPLAPGPLETYAQAFDDLFAKRTQRAAFRRYLQGVGVVKPITFALVRANLINAGACWALVYGEFGLPRMGVEGSGWATCLARVYLMAVVVGAFAIYGPLSTISSTLAGFQGQRAVEMFRAAGAREVAVLDPQDRLGASRSVREADLIWMPGGGESADERQRAFVLRVQEDPALHHRAEII